MAIETTKIYKTTGSVNEVIKRIQANLYKWHNDDRIRKVYVGKTSATSSSRDDVRKAMDARYDSYKAEMGITEMKLLYTTSSERNINKVEKATIEYNDSQGKKSINIRAGGGGRRTDRKECYVLYAALKQK